MESGDPRPSASGWASPPPPDPPPPPPTTGWLAGLVSGAGRILASVLGPDSSGGGSGSTAASDGDSPSASCSSASSRLHGEGRNDRADHGGSSLLSLKNNQLNQGEGETMLKDYAGSLAIVSEIEPKDAIMQLLMQETFSRSECTKFIKIIQERVSDSDSGTIPKLTHINQSPFTHNANNIQPVLKRSCSERGDAYEDIRRVRPKINGNPFSIPKFNQVDVIKNHPAANSREEHKTKNLDASSGENTLTKVFPGAINLTYPEIISKVESADEVLDVPNKPSVVTPQAFDSGSSQGGGDQMNYGTTIFNRCSSQDLRKGFPLKVEPLDVGTPFEQQMMDLSHQKQEHDVSNDSCSLSKLMLKEDIEAASSLPMGIQLQKCSENCRGRQSDLQKATPAPTRSPAKGSRRTNNDISVKTEMDLLEESKVVLMEQEPPELGDISVKRPVRRMRKVR